MRNISPYKFLIVAFMCVIGASNAMAKVAEEGLPETVIAQTHTPLEQVGNGTYRRFGFTVYHATLWAPEGKYDPNKTYALKLHYTRSVDKETLVETVTDNIRDQKVTDEATLATWQTTLNTSLPAVEDGDTIIGVSIPNKDAVLYVNGQKTGSIADKKFSQAFFNIWLGETADEDMRDGLLGKAQ